MPVYFRAFEKPEWADQFVAGAVRIQSFSQCRAMEGHRRDAGEGTMQYTSGTYFGSSSSAAIATVSRRIGADIRNCPDVVISHCVSRIKETEALLVCMTTKPRDYFGPYVVRIHRPTSLFFAVQKALRRGGHLQLGVTNGFLQSVAYRPREYAGLDPTPPHPALIKPPEPFERDGEIRMVWPVPRIVSEPFFVEVGADYCTRIS